VTKFALGEAIEFRPKKGKVRKGVIAPGFVDVGEVKVHLEGDPFPVNVKRSQVSGCNPERKVLKSKKKAPNVGVRTNKEKETMADTSTKPSAKELRKQAQALGVEGWEDMGRSEMAKAIKRKLKEEKGSSKSKTSSKAKSSKSKPSKTKPAASKPEAAEKQKKAKATNGTSKPASKAKAPAKKAAAKAEPKAPKAKTIRDDITLPEGTPPKPLPDEGVNPFRKSSNLFVVAKLLLKGGTRRSLATQLSEKVSLHPYHKGQEEVELLDFDKRLLLGAQTMRDQFGYGIHRVGRGLDGKILVFRPDGPKDPRTKSKSKK
jgi:hypothetical protein